VEQGGQQPCGLLPERAGAPFAAFAVQAHQRVLAEVEVLGAQAGGLLRAGAGVVEEQDQGAVPQRERAVAGQVPQEVFDLVAFEEPGFPAGRCV
jgi:hypothetical protein